MHTCLARAHSTPSCTFHSVLPCHDARAQQYWHVSYSSWTCFVLALLLLLCYKCLTSQAAVTSAASSVQQQVTRQLPRRQTVGTNVDTDISISSSSSSSSSSSNSSSSTADVLAAAAQEPAVPERCVHHQRLHNYLHCFALYMYCIVLVSNALMLMTKGLISVDAKHLEVFALNKLSASSNGAHHCKRLKQHHAMLLSFVACALLYKQQSRPQCACIHSMCACHSETASRIQPV
jgi:hypothetical protein